MAFVQTSMNVAKIRRKQRNVSDYAPPEHLSQTMFSDFWQKCHLGLKHSYRQKLIRLPQIGLVYILKLNDSLTNDSGINFTSFSIYMSLNFVQKHPILSNFLQLVPFRPFSAVAGNLLKKRRDTESKGKFYQQGIEVSEKTTRFCFF